MGIEFAEMSYADLMSDAGRMITNLHQESSPFKELSLNFDHEKWKAGEEDGRVRIYSARKSGELVGFVVFFIGNNIHFADSLYAEQNFIYILKEHRGFALEFMNWCNDELKNIGVDYVSYHARAGHKFNDSLILGGYSPTYVHYYKKLNLEAANVQQ